MKILCKKLFSFFTIVWVLFSAGCNVANPDPNAVWRDLEFFHAKYPFMHYTGVLRQITEYGEGEWRPDSPEELADRLKEGYKKVYLYKAALSLFSSSDGNAWQPVKFYSLSYGFPPQRDENYYSPDLYARGFDGFETWETRPVLDFRKKDTIFLKIAVRPHDKNLPKKYCIIQLKRPKAKRSTGDKYLLFLNYAPCYPYQKITLPPWGDWRAVK